MDSTYDQMKFLEGKGFKVDQQDGEWRIEFHGVPGSDKSLVFALEDCARRTSRILAGYPDAARIAEAAFNELRSAIPPDLDLTALDDDDANADPGQDAR
jgi:hypothetical protein